MISWKTNLQISEPKEILFAVSKFAASKGEEPHGPRERGARGARRAARGQGGRARGEGRAARGSGRAAPREGPPVKFSSKFVTTAW